MSGNLFERLRSDHQIVLAHASAIESAVAGGDSAAAISPEVGQLLGEMLALLERRFAVHLRVEEDALYPALVAALPEARATVRPLAAEHTELRVMLATLLETIARAGSAARDEQLTVQVRDLADLLRIHIRKEEAVVFTIAERVLSAEAVARLGESPPAHPITEPSPHQGRGDSKGIQP
jgi:hemerythrin-like domain-containing protein